MKCFFSIRCSKFRVMDQNSFVLSDCKILLSPIFQEATYDIIYFLAETVSKKKLIALLPKLSGNFSVTA